MGMASALLFGLMAVGAAPAPNFSGTWVLDKAKSEGLGRGMQNAEKVVWNIKQTDKELTVTPEITPGAGGGGAGGGGGQGRGGGGMGGPSTYKLDGTDHVVEGQNGMKSTFKAKWAGEALELSRVTSIQDRTITSKEKWELADGGKVLKVVQTRETQQGPQESKLTFNKQ
jgi:hypothetical protein